MKIGFISLPTLDMDSEQEIWANTHETRDSISLISYAGVMVYLN